MTDTTKPTETKDQAEDQDLINIDEIDKMILSEDPSFAQDLESMKGIPNDGSIDLEIIDTGEEVIIEDNPWQGAVGLRGILVKIFPFLSKLWEKKQILKKRFRKLRASWRTKLVEFIRVQIPAFFVWCRLRLKDFFVFLKGRAVAFKELHWKMKVVAALLTAAMGGTFYFVFRSLNHGIIPEEKELFIASLEEWSGQKYLYDAESEMDSFYDSTRTIQHIMALPKMVVNIQRSKSSGTNPMAAMEFFIEGMSPEAIVEVKDRESEMRDLFQRTIEEMSFDELDSAEGKQLLTEKLRRTLNGVLTKGQVRRVFIKESVIKP